MFSVGLSGLTLFLTQDPAPAGLFTVGPSDLQVITSFSSPQRKKGSENSIDALANATGYKKT